MAVTGTKAIYAVVGVSAAVGMTFVALNWAESQRLKNVVRLRDKLIAVRPSSVTKGTAIGIGGPTFAELEQVDLESLDSFKATVPMNLIAFEDHLKAALRLLATGYSVAMHDGRRTLFPKV